LPAFGFGKRGRTENKCESPCCRCLFVVRPSTSYAPLSGRNVKFESIRAVVL
jgi:hypothetical protein